MAGWMCCTCQKRLKRCPTSETERRNTPTGTKNSGWNFSEMEILNASLYYPTGDIQCRYYSNNPYTEYTYISTYGNPSPTVTKQSGTWVDGQNSWGTYSSCGNDNSKNCVIDVELTQNHQ